MVKNIPVSSFEESLGKLEEIVSSLDGGELKLEDSIKKFEEGVVLYKNCKKILTEVEKKISKLTKDLKEEDFLLDE